MLERSPFNANDVRLSRFVRLIGYFLAIMIAIGAFVSAKELRNREIASWERQTSQLSLTMAENVSQQMSSAFLALDAVAEKIQDYATVDSSYLQSKVRTPEFHQILAEKARSSPQIEVIGIVDEHGKLINFSRYFPVPDFDLSDRDYFQVQRDGKLQGIFISRPIRNKTNGRWTFFISRRLTGSDGEFMGIVQLGISPNYYTDFFQRFSIAEPVRINMYRDDLTLLASWPVQDEAMGKQILDDAANQVVHVRKLTSGVAFTETPFSENPSRNVLRMGAVQTANKYPIIISSMIDEDTYLGEWHKNVTVISVIAIVSIGVILLAFNLLAVMLRQREDNLRAATVLKQRAEEANRIQAELLENLTQQQAELKATSDRLQATFLNAADGIVMSDENGHIEAFNPAAEMIYGFKQEEVVGKHSKLFTPPGENDIWEMINASEEFRQSGKIHLESERLRKDGSVFTAEMAVSAYHMADKQKLIVIVRDITARRKMEKLKNEFISTVSHELRTPLTAIRGALGLVVGGAVGTVQEKALSMLRIAHQNSEGLTRLINDLLDIQRLEIGKINYVFEIFPAQDLLRTAIQSNSAVAENYGVHLEYAGLPTTRNIYVDAGRFQQVMANLISNACKYAPKGSTITVQVQSVKESMLRIEVNDEGVGIPEDFQNRIFEKFSQADSSDTRAKGGTGLGLSITRALVQQMHGEIGYYTSQGFGTTFYVDFPTADPDRAA